MPTFHDSPALYYWCGCAARRNLHHQSRGETDRGTKCVNQGWRLVSWPGPDAWNRAMDGSAPMHIRCPSISQSRCPERVASHVAVPPSLGPSLLGPARTLTWPPRSLLAVWFQPATGQASMPRPGWLRFTAAWSPAEVQQCPVTASSVLSARGSRQRRVS